ncbi:MAG: hypothetical protein ACD_57C00211G0003 [uncultured bacterium]|nr:MAG: hypothetical protein ACD_57C00211G0003 [uncultured bacterium]KKR77115.1 MAG: hypothetical protein UU19_C0019G0015 [Candidatus Curtissbacteria bacterium GW2011_GWD1_40_8]KKS00384.1 MAG: hypothetical protein UU53_C0035G0002 [Candidatus Curtissbacteria bacterium GW2011_GWC2_41_21]
MYDAERRSDFRLGVELAHLGVGQRSEIWPTDVDLVEVAARRYESAVRRSNIRIKRRHTPIRPHRRK